MDFTKLDLAGFVTLLLPGVLIVQAFHLVRDVSLRPLTKDDLAIYPFYALLYAAYLWLFEGGPVKFEDALKKERWELARLYIFVPLILGALFGAFARYRLFGRFCEAVGIPLPKPPSPIRTPWPVVAPGIAVGTYVMVILKDKTLYRALVTEDSLLSSDQDRIDLYLGQTFEGENWVPSKPQRAVYIRGSEIQSIEIWKLEGTASERGNSEEQ